MNKVMDHIAFIPARKGSKGFPEKNVIFFDLTADFIDQIGWFNRVLVSSNDEKVIEKAKSRKYEIIERSEELSGSTVSIKEVIKDASKKIQPTNQSIIWLFYIPILFKEDSHFNEVKKIIEKKSIKSIISFLPAETHPYNCWQIHESRITQYVKNNVYRRQDLPKAWCYHHYICSFNLSVLDQLDNELMNEETYPYLLDELTREKIVEIDTPLDLEKWKDINRKSRKIK